jgi:hypothetical protein
MLSITDIIWNRACYGGGDSPRAGDKHLAALLHYHGAAMNSGVFHATEFCSASEIRDAKDGYRYFGLGEVATLIQKSEALLKAKESPADYEREFDAAYFRLAGGSILFARFLEGYEQSPEEYSSVQ